MPDTDRNRSSSARSYSLGIELAAAVAGFALLGYWIDRHYGTGPWGILICVALGLVGGTYNLVRGALRQSRKPAAKSPPPDGPEGA